MKLSHNFFFRLLVIAGATGTIVQGVGVLFAEKFSTVPWYGFFAYTIALCAYGIIWAITPEKWWVG